MSFSPPRAGVAYADMTEELKKRQAGCATLARSVCTLLCIKRRSRRAILFAPLLMAVARSNRLRIKPRILFNNSSRIC